MIITLVAEICHPLPNSPATYCMEEIITDSSASPDLTFMGCQISAQQGIAKWLEENRPGWTLAKWKCIPGHYVIRGQA